MSEHTTTGSSAALERAEQVLDRIEREAETKRNAIAAVLGSSGVTSASESPKQASA